MATKTPPTEKQVAFATKLLEERFAGPGDDNDAEAKLASYEFIADADRREMSAFIAALLVNRAEARKGQQ